MGPKFEGKLIPQYDGPIDPVTGVRQGTPIARGGTILKVYPGWLLTTNSISFRVLPTAMLGFKP
jgi:hypothetical protein